MYFIQREGKVFSIVIVQSVMPYRGATEIRGGIKQKSTDNFSKKILLVKNIKQNKLVVDGIWIGRFLLSFFLSIIMVRVDPAILFGDCTFPNVIYNLHPRSSFHLILIWFFLHPRHVGAMHRANKKQIQIYAQWNTSHISFRCQILLSTIQITN